ncbi:MAG: DMT family protein [Terriglobia bacterium]|jgi:hypothetical protein
MSTVLLLFLSNVFMTFAWYGRLKYGHNSPFLAWPRSSLLRSRGPDGPSERKRGSSRALSAV